MNRVEIWRMTFRYNFVDASLSREDAMKRTSAQLGYNEDGSDYIPVVKKKAVKKKTVKKFIYPLNKTPRPTHNNPTTNLQRGSRTTSAR